MAGAPTKSVLTGKGQLDKASQCSMPVLTEVETLGMARSLGWKVHIRCAEGYREDTKSIRRCVYRRQVDLDTLVCTRAARANSYRRKPEYIGKSRDINVKGV
jgi:hypothetical protein